MNPLVQVSYESTGFAVSIGLAVLASYIGLDVALRVHLTAHVAARRLWLAAGAVVLGTGIWTMHFVGMSAAQFPFAVGYAPLQTGLSWLAAVAVAGAVLVVAVQRRLSLPFVSAAAVVAGLGASGMHHLGMQALWVVPAVTRDWRWTIASLLVMIGGGIVTLLLFSRLRGLRGWARVRWHIAASAVFGGALAAMHYMAMAGAGYDPNSVCLTTEGLNGRQLDHVITLAVGVLLLLMLLMTTLHRWSESQAKQMQRSLTTAEERLRFVTFNDVVTGLPNRLVFQDRLSQSIARCGRRGRGLAVAMVDIDGFRYLNEQHGDAFGDHVLRSIAGALTANAREADTVARVGPDEFLFILEEIDGALDASPMLERIRESLDRGLSHQGRECHVTASIGVSLFPSDGEQAVLVNNAASALAAVKQLGGNQVRFFEAALDIAARQDADLVRELRKALAGDQLELYYQPKIHARSGLVTGAEALLRWHHPSRGLLGPGIFVPLAERYGLINAIGDWVIERACRQIADWREDGLSMRTAINLSVHQLRQPELASRIDEALRRFSVEPSLLTCEVTESMAMDVSAATIDLFAQLRAIGVMLSIDDFGTGYSSLAYLRKLPFHQLKVDRSFVIDLEGSREATAVVAAIVQLSHALGLEVVAEGVETEAQRRILVGLGVDKLQGYLFAKPMPADALAEMAHGKDRATSPGFRASLFAPV